MVHTSHLPSIDPNKKLELERKIDELQKPKARERPEKQSVYLPDTYKKEPVSKSIDWAAMKNPLVPDPKPTKKEFVKINYLRDESIKLKKVNVS